LKWAGERQCSQSANNGNLELTRLKNLAINVGVLLLTLTLLVLLVEAGLAVARINGKSYTRFVPGKGVTFIPRAYYRYNKEGFSEGYFNSHGFRDYERAYEKPKGTFRILILGDSYVEALQVALADSFPALLENHLNRLPGDHPRFEVLAMGQSGAGTADAYMRYLDFGARYSPDLVINAFLTGNDFRNNSKFLNREAFGFYIVSDEHENLVLDSSVVDAYEKSLTLPKRLFVVLKEHSYLASLLSERSYLLRDQLREGRFDANPPAPGLNEFDDLNVYLPNPSKNWKDAFQITKKVILKFRDSVEERGARFAIVTLSNAEQVHPDVQKKIKERYPRINFDFEQPDRILDEFSRDNRVMLLKLMPAFLAYHLRSGRYLHGFGTGHGGHWNENGHRLAADEILAFLKDKRLIPFQAANSVGLTAEHVSRRD
jgi:hypothetical protein